jgi:hypothetical protein
MSEVAAQSDSTFSVFPFHYLQAAEFCIVAQGKVWPYEILGSGEKRSPLTLTSAITYAGVDPDILFLSRIQQAIKNQAFVLFSFTVWMANCIKIAFPVPRRYAEHPPT